MKRNLDTGKVAKKLLCGLLASLLLTTAGCSGKPTAQAGDILTQKPTETGRTPVTVLVKYAFSINGFEKAVEEKFPDIDLVQVGNYTREMGIDEYAARLEHDDLTDIVMTWPLDVGREYWPDRLLDLSGMDFTSSYNLSMLGQIEQDGKLYYLPGPAQIRGIVYNKTLFAEKGWQVPTDYEGFVELCKTIEASGMRSLQLGFKNSEVLDTAFIGYSYGQCFSTPAARQWVNNFDKNRQGSMGEQFGPALDTFVQMRDAGIWQAGDLEIDYSRREQMLFGRQCAMVEDSALMARMGPAFGNSDEFGLMPFFNPGVDNCWARLYMVCYIGLNKHLVEPQNKEKYDLVLKLMEYISTVEGQAALASDTGAMISSHVDSTPPDIPEIEKLLPALNHGRYAVFPQPKNAKEAFRQGLAGILRGELTVEQCVAMVDEENRTPVAETPPEVLGTAKQDFTMVETGSFIADVMRDHAKTDFALFLDNGKDGTYNGKGLSGRLYGGDVTRTDLLRILPDTKLGEKGVVWKVTMTGENLQKALEHTMDVGGLSNWFYYFSGLQLHYNPQLAPGSRIQSIATAEGKAIEPQALYTVAVMDGTVDETLLAAKEETSGLLMDLLVERLQQQESIVPPADGRFTFS